MTEPWQTLPPEEVCRRLGVDPGRGLSRTKASERLAALPKNPEARGPNPLLLLLRQFQSAVVLLLLLASLIALFLGETLDSLAIFAALLLNAFVGFLTEYQASAALAALRKLTVLSARTLRDAQEEQIPTPGLVPGDIVILAGGDKVPGDGRLLEAERLLVDESILTGESLPVEKTVPPIPADTPIPEQKNMVFGSTTVLDGTGRMVLTALGPESELGRIGKLLEGGPETTPLEQKLDQMGNHLLWIVGVLALLITGVGLWHGEPLGLMLETGIAMAIAAIPEGLPVVATLALAVGMGRMARCKVLIRRLAAVESLGSVTVIAVDKTGTLTNNAMTVKVIATAHGEQAFPGEGYDPGEKIAVPSNEVRQCLTIGVLANDATLECGEEGWHIHGDPSEAALLVAAKKGGIERTALAEEMPRIKEIPFESGRKRMTVVCQSQEGEIAFSKGAPEVLLPSCDRLLANETIAPLTEGERARVEQQNLALSERGMRVLALAWKERPGETPEEGMVFAGLVGMLDPPKPGVKEALQQCHRAGIRTVMITGDHPVTARAIAEQLRLAEDLRLTRDPSEVADVYARISPEDKLRIVRALKEHGEIAAMTGDGVNDAPALKAADIGIAMGSGADVAKEASAMILVDNNFQSIVRAIEEGRIIDENIRKATLFLLTCSFSMLGIVSGAIVLDFGLPLLPLQILWLNLLIHVFPALGLALEPGDGHELERRPHPPSEPILSRKALRQIAVGSLLVIGIALGLLQAVSQSAILVFVAFMLVAHSFSMQTEDIRVPRPTPALLGAAAVVVLLQLAAITWLPLRTVLGTRPLTGSEWTIVLLSIGFGFLADELTKLGLFPRPHA